MRGEVELDSGVQEGEGVYLHGHYIASIPKQGWQASSSSKDSCV